MIQPLKQGVFNIKEKELMAENDDREKWINAILSSSKGIKRAQAGKALFLKIQEQLHQPQMKVITLLQWRRVAVAALILGLLNVFALRQYTHSHRMSSDSSVEENLISNYNLYD